MSQHEEAGHGAEAGQGADGGMTNADIVKIIINLVVIYAVGAGILAGVYSWASPKMFIANKIAKEQALKAMMPEADKIEKMGSWSPHGHGADYFEVKKGGERIGFIVETFGKGYSSFINTLVALDANLVIKKISILHHGETPGLGDEVESPVWKDQFKGKTLDVLKVVKTDEPGIQAISGATISSRAVTGDKTKGIVGVQGGVQMLTDALAGKKPAEGGHEGGHH